MVLQQIAKDEVVVATVSEPVGRVMKKVPNALPRACRIRADRDMVAQIAAITEIVSQCVAEMASRKNARAFGLGDDNVPAGHRRLFTPSDLDDRVEWAKTLPDETQRMVKQHLAIAEKLGSIRRVSTVPFPESLDRLDRQFPNFAEITALIRRQNILAGLTSEKICTFPPLLLDGPPGIGKTIFSNRLATALGMPYFEVDGSTLTAGFALSGLDTGWGSSKPGLVWDALQNECMSPLFVLDELDKASTGGRYDSLGFLYSLLERHSARRFQDAALRLPIDASHIGWIATCNDVQRIEPALVSRFNVIRIEAPNQSQMPSVIESIQADILKDVEWATAFGPVLTANVSQRLLQLTPRGVRKALETGYALAAEAGRRHLIPSDIKLPRLTTTQSMGFLS